MPKSPTVGWTREHLLIALNLYGKLSFGQFHHNNPLIIDVAVRMGRSPSSLAMKLSNLASLDPVQTKRGIKGLSGASNQDRAMWKEFHANFETLGPESEQLLHDLFTEDDDQEVNFLERDRISLEPSKNQPSGSTETKVLVRARRGQQFFRQTVLTAYGIRCCITGINIPRLLVASHIKPWATFPHQRLDPRNGLCLSSLHDAAFDAGLIGLDNKFRLVLSKELKKYFPMPVLEQNFTPFENLPIRLPDKTAEPAPEFVRYHRTNIFKR